MIVIDTNIISYFYLRGERSEQAYEARRKDPAWVAPWLWRSEFQNVLILYVRKRNLTFESAQEIMQESLRLMAGNEYQVASEHVLRLAAGSECSAYDCEFVALAQDLSVRLVTVDKQILSEFPNVAVSLDAYLTTC